MEASIKAHIDRVKSVLDPATNNLTIASYLTKNTVLKGNLFSFKDHEYQEVLLRDKARRKFCVKCSQIGISELGVRRVIAVCQIFNGVVVYYVLPTAGFASQFSSTRLATALEGCRLAKANLYKTDSHKIKRFLNESFIYMGGGAKASQAISVPVDFLVVDEVDFAEDQGVLTSFESRLTHSDYKDEMWFSTPTVGNYGITQLFDNSIQHVEMYKCSKCNHHFVPNYYEHVVLPGFNRPLQVKGKGLGRGLISTNTTQSQALGTERSLKELNFYSKQLLTNYPLKEAYVECPKCRRPVNQYIRYRKFVQVNPEANFEEHGYRITPFAAPKHVPPSEIIRKSTVYKHTKDFVNFTLGLDYDDATTGLSQEELEGLFADRSENLYPDSPPFQISGTDLGGTCAHLTGYPAPNGHIRIQTAARIPLHKFQKDYLKSLAVNDVISSVCDAMPYTDTVAALQSRIPTMWACLFSKKKGLELYSIKSQEEDEEKATYGLRQIDAKKHALLDFVVMMIRAGKISFGSGALAEKDHIISHMRDLKRIKITNMDGEEEYVWRKSARGVDHYFFALAYLVLANFVKGVGGGGVPLPALIGSFKMKTEV